MLDNLPHDQAFSQLIVRQMETYARKCTSWYQALVSRGSPTATGRKLRAPAAWAESAEMEDLVNQVFQTDPRDAINFNTLIEQETSLLLPTIEKEPLDQGDIIQDKKTLTSQRRLHDYGTSATERQTQHASSLAINATTDDGHSSHPQSLGLKVHLYISH